MGVQKLDTEELCFEHRDLKLKVEDARRELEEAEAELLRFEQDHPDIP